ncbi:MAG: nucleotide exchange factor GrpE [Pseudonocardiaceae bacterium]
MTGQIRVPPGEQPVGGDQPSGGGRPIAGSAGGRPIAGSAGGVQVDEGLDVGDTVQVGAEELGALRSQLEERTGDLQRVTAEYTNYRRRVDRDRQVAITWAKAQVAGELLTVLDDIERAEAHGDLSGPFKAVADKVVAGLQAHGLEPFGTVGDGFDPDVHEAVQHSTSPDVEGPTVTVVLRRGYRFGERVLRPAMVVVTDAEPSTTEPSATEQSAEPAATSRDAARSGGPDPAVGH